MNVMRKGIKNKDLHLLEREVVENISEEGVSSWDVKGEGWRTLSSTGNNRYKLPWGTRKQEGPNLSYRLSGGGKSFLLLTVHVFIVAFIAKSQYLQQSADIIFTGVSVHTSYPVLQPLLNDRFFFRGAPKQILFVGLLDKMGCYRSQSC